MRSQYAVICRSMLDRNAPNVLDTKMPITTESLGPNYLICSCANLLITYLCSKANFCILPLWTNDV
jgi:hypothetical protein